MSIADGAILVGESKRGMRAVTPITGGRVSGRLEADVLRGGADFQLFGAVVSLDARYTLRTDDGELIIVRNCGQPGSLIPTFEVRTKSQHAWLSENRWLSDDPVLASGAVNITVRARK